MLIGIREVFIIATPRALTVFKELLGEERRLCILAPKLKRLKDNLENEENIIVDREKRLEEYG